MLRYTQTAEGWCHCRHIRDTLYYLSSKTVCQKCWKKKEYFQIYAKIKVSPTAVLDAASDNDLILTIKIYADTVSCGVHFIVPKLFEILFRSLSFFGHSILLSSVASSTILLLVLHNSCNFLFNVTLVFSL